ncbi:MAG: 50S ribosomal protein L21 [Patescibacteria group bacterium]
MFAIIETGGKQYRAETGKRLVVETLSGNAGDRVTFERVLLVSGGKETRIGAPYLPKASVDAVVLRQFRGDRAIVFRYHSKTRYRKFKTHRQPLTEVEITKIN